MKQKLIQILGVCALLCLGLITEAQTRTVTGTVLDDNGQGVIGAMVKEKGTTNGAYTGANGAFTINLTSAEPVLVITSFGLKEKEVVVGTSTTITVKMAPSDETIGEVVVTAQNIKKSSRSLGYSVTSVSDVALTEGGDRSVLNSIQGKVAGVDINVASTDPGASTRVVIRGLQSLTGGNQPLIVVDGVPLTNSSLGSNNLSGAFDFGNGLNAINPEDIASMDILKGSNATALYGSRAANGVIMITTKKGNEGVATKSKGIGVAYSGNTTFFDVLRMPEFQNKFGQGWDGNHWLDENGSWGPIMDDRDRVFGRVVDNSQLLKPFSPLENNVREFFETGMSVKNHVAINGGNADRNFYASFSNVNHDGIYPDGTDGKPIDVYNRNTIALRAMQRFGKVRVSGTMNFADTRTGFVPTGQGQEGIYNNLMQLPRDMSVLDMQDYTAKYYNVEDYFTAYGVTNPYFILNSNQNDYKGTKFYGGLETTIDILDNLSATYRFGYDIENHNTHVHRAILLPEGVNAGSVDDPGFVSEQMNNRTQFNHDFLLSWNKSLSSLINLDVTGGLNMNQRGTNSLFMSVNGIDIGGFYNVSNSGATPNISETETLRRLVGAFGIASVSYKNYLFLNVSARNDWSSTLPEENRAFFYPAANVSYVFTDAIAGIPEILNYGKLRVGYGHSGNDASPYVISQVYTQAGNYMPWRTFNYPLASGINSFEMGNRVANPSLTPEITKELEIGADLKFWDNRIIVDFTYYNRTTENQILQVSLAPSSGWTYYFANPAQITNQGIEAVLSYRILRNEDGLNWMISGNFTRNRNNVDQLDPSIEELALGGLSTTAFVAVAGQPIGIFKGEVPETNPDNPDQIVVDANGVPVAATDKEYYGNAQNNYILGISNSLSWKGLSLGFTFDTRQGGLMFSRTADINFFTGNSVKTTLNDRKPFVVPNSVQKIDNGDGTFSYVENTIPVDPAHMDDYHRASALDRQNVIDKSFTKLREVVLSYRLPQNITDKTPFAGVTVSLIGRNLFLWTPVDNQFVDPEVTSWSTSTIESSFGEFSANPTTRSYGFALMFNL
ncbi:MAG: SusC/RagA family TonB-linked outer membrane protein [Bacteroidia bacterium]